MVLGVKKILGMQQTVMSMMVKMIGFLTQGDDLQPTHNDYNTTTDYRCLDEIMIIASQSSQTGETRPVVLKSFGIKVKILKASSSPFKLVRDG